MLREFLQSDRVEYAKSCIKNKGFEITFENETTLKFQYNGNEITIYPYTGWFTGKGIKDGRGIINLTKQLK